jgi:hypothetical protein
MQIELKAETVPFKIPDGTIVKVAGDELLQSLETLPPDVLSALCDEFRAGVFARAEVSDPREAKPAAGAPRTQELQKQLIVLDDCVSRLLRATESRVQASAEYQKALTALQEALS